MDLSITCEKLKAENSKLNSEIEDLILSSRQKPKKRMKKNEKRNSQKESKITKAD